MKQLKLMGNSPFDVRLIDGESRTSVCKFASNDKDMARLFKQALKQKAFSQFIEEDETLKNLFHVPMVYNIGQGKDFSFCMEYVRGHNILDILEYGDVTQLEGIMNKLWILIHKEVKASTWQVVPVDTIREKLYAIMASVSKEYLPLGYAIEKEITRSLNVPVGICHGDMTFANMIFNDKINLIDFLDSFIETPIQDIAKIEQELSLIWTLEMQRVHPQNRIKVCLGYNHLRKLFTKQVNDFGFEYELKIFTLLTLYRLIPYVKCDEVILKIKSEIERLL